MDKEIFLSQFGHLASGPEGIKKLRDMVRQLAVQGKLIEQNPSDTEVDSLLSRMRSDKSLAPDGIKRPKNWALKAVGLSDIELPQNWAWATLGNISESIQYGFTASADASIYEPKFLRITDIQNSRVNWETVPGCEIDSKKSSQYLLSSNDILIARTGGTIGKSFLVENVECKSVFASYLIRIRTLTGGVLPRYLKVFLESPMYWKQLRDSSKGTGQPNVNGTELSKLNLPFPPFAEQKRIVAKVEELMALCDELEVAKVTHVDLKQDCVSSTLHHLTESPDKQDIKINWSITETNFNDWFDNLETVKSLRSTILQLAVQGKLVEQDSNEGTASDVLKSVRAIVSKLNKKQLQKLPPLLDKDVPFNLPETWTWARFPELGEFGRGKSKHRPRNDPRLYQGGTIPLVQTGDVARSNGRISSYTGLYNDEGLAQSRLWPAGTMCITIAANIADTGILTFDACFPDSVVGFIPDSMFKSARYFEYFLRTAKADLLKFAPSTAQKNINLGILEKVVIPLPPLAEQDRIVAKVDEMMALCDQLEEQITTSKRFNQDLMASLCHQLTAVG